MLVTISNFELEARFENLGKDAKLYKGKGLHNLSVSKFYITIQSVLAHEKCSVKCNLYKYLGLIIISAYR